jgi:hypothetical protein
MRPELLDYIDGLAAFKLDGEVVRLPGLTAEGAQNVLEIRTRGDRVFVTLGYTTNETPALLLFHGGRIVSRGVD